MQLLPDWCKMFDQVLFFGNALSKNKIIGIWSAFYLGIYFSFVSNNNNGIFVKRKFSTEKMKIKKLGAHHINKILNAKVKTAGNHIKND